jgi:hypothetical protein
MKKLDKLKVENKKLRAKGNKAITHSSSSEDGDSEESLQEGEERKKQER